MSVRRTRKDDGSQWTVADSRSVYGIRHWGAGYFAINDAGRVEVRPNGPTSSPIDLFEQVDRRAGRAVRTNFDATGVIDREIPGPPMANPVNTAAVRNCPLAAIVFACASYGHRSPL